MALTSIRERPQSPGAAGVLALLTLALCINYIDRTNLSLAAPLLKDELRLSATQLGTLLSAFFWAYTCLQIPCGWLVDHLEVKWVLAAGFFLWSAATAATSALHGFAALLVVRVILGIGESVAVPSCTKIIALRFAEKDRGLANSVVLMGLSLGPCAGILIGGTAIARFGWRPFFLALGLLGLLWLLPWVALMPKSRKAFATPAGPAVGLRRILLCRSAWGTFIGQFCYNYCLYLMVTWLPFYLVRGRSFSLAKMTRIGALVFLVSAISATLWGKCADRWISAGQSPTKVRKTVLILGQIGLGIFLIISPFVPDAFCPWTLALVGMCLGGGSSSCWAITQRLAGPQLSGRWIGAQNFFGNFAGLVAPALTGFLLDRTGRFHWPFFIAGAVACVGALAVAFVVGPVEQIVWSTETRKVDARGVRAAALSG
jgi:ACS family D-galactonate transporter-like MFS transporter